MRWDTAREKFERLTSGIDGGLRGEIVGAVSRLEEFPVTDMTRLLGKVTLEDHV